MNDSLMELKNIGRTVAERLNAIGIDNQVDLERLGSAEAYRRLSEQNRGKHMPVCYYLYSLEGAIHGRHWGDFSEDEKSELRKAAGLD